MGQHDWFEEYEWHALAAGDRERLRLAWYHREAYRHRESDPDLALSLIQEGRAHAETLREPWWVLHYDQQRAHALLHFKQDFREVLDLAVRNTLEVRKTAYTGFPRLALIHLDLVSAYLGIDPEGHADAIRQALDYLDAETPTEGDDRYLVLGAQRQVALEAGRLDEAEGICRRSQALAAADPDHGRARHFLVFTYGGLCEVAWRRGDWAALAELAEAGEQLARQVGHQVELAGFWMMQALCFRREGDSVRAAHCYGRVIRRLDGLGMPPDASLRDAECAYHEMGGALDLALAGCDAELERLRDKGRLARECACLTRRVYLLARLGRLGEGDLGRARRAAGRLRRPDLALERLGRAARGEAP